MATLARPATREEYAHRLELAPAIEDGRAAPENGGLRLLARHRAAGAEGEAGGQRVGEPSGGELIAHLGDERAARGAGERRLEIGGGDPLPAPRRRLVVGLPFLHILSHRRRSPRLAEQDEPVQLHVGRARDLGQLLVPANPVVHALLAAREERVELALPPGSPRHGRTHLHVAPGETLEGIFGPAEMVEGIARGESEHVSHEQSDEHGGQPGRPRMEVGPRRSRRRIGRERKHVGFEAGHAAAV